MSKSLFVLEKSLGNKKRYRSVGKKSREMKVFEPASLQDQMDVVKGRRLGRASQSLRALESRFLGASQVRNIEHKTKDHSLHKMERLDYGQASLPKTYPNSSESPSTTHQIVNQSGFSPEFSAPGTGRFHVEGYVEPDDAQELGSDLIPPASLQKEQQAEIPRVPRTKRTEGIEQQIELPVADGDWFDQTHEQEPQKITKASRDSLNSGAALAKEDFERDLAEILGDASPDQSHEDSPLPEPQIAHKNPSEKNEEDASNESSPHQGHEIFDQMGLGMQYANSFDLGAVDLKSRFDQFDQQLEVQEEVAPMAPVETNKHFVDPYTAQMGLDEFDLVAELAEMGAEAPQREETVCIPDEELPLKDSVSTEPSSVVLPDKQAGSDDVSEIESVKSKANNQKVGEDHE